MKIKEALIDKVKKTQSQTPTLEPILCTFLCNYGQGNKSSAHAGDFVMWLI